MKEASVTAGLRSSNIRVIDVARLPTGPAKPDVRRNIFLGFLLGLAGGVALAFLQESMDTTVGSLEELSAITALPMLGVIPLQVAENGRRHLHPAGGSLITALTVDGPVAHVRPKSEAAESGQQQRKPLLQCSNGLAVPGMDIDGALDFSSYNAAARTWHHHHRRGRDCPY